MLTKQNVKEANKHLVELVCCTRNFQSTRGFQCKVLKSSYSSSPSSDNCMPRPLNNYIHRYFKITQINLWHCQVTLTMHCYVSTLPDHKTCDKRTFVTSLCRSEDNCRKSDRGGKIRRLCWSGYFTYKLKSSIK